MKRINRFYEVDFDLPVATGSESWRCVASVFRCDQITPVHVVPEASGPSPQAARERAHALALEWVLATGAPVGFSDELAALIQADRASAPAPLTRKQ